MFPWRRIVLALCLFAASGVARDRYDLPPAVQGEAYHFRANFPVKGVPDFTYSLEPHLAWLSVASNSPDLTIPMPANAMPGVYDFVIVATDSSMPPVVTRRLVRLRVLAGHTVSLPPTGALGSADTAVPAAAAAAAPAACPMGITAPMITTPLREGTRVVSGYATATAGMTSAAVELLADGDQLALASSVDSRAATNDHGLFTATLQFPLSAGQMITVRQHVASTGAAAAPVATGACTDSVGAIVRNPVDWGRVRAYFVGGTVIANDNNNFSGSHASLFLAFDVDKNWLWAPPEGQGWRRLMFNTFFETRLTSIPVLSQSSTPAAAPPAGGTPPATPSTPSTLDTFIASRKSANLQGGAYFPFVVSNWRHQNAPNALFLAPIAKVGFMTPVDSPPAQGGGAVANPVNTDRFYTFYGWGGRVGHYKMSETKNASPELVSYIDVIVGRWGNLPVTVAQPVLDPVTGQPRMNTDGSIMTQQLSQRRYRVGVEGLLKVPSTPIVLGFSANVGQNLSTLPHQSVAAKDDLRFFFGVKFDVGNLVGRLSTL